MEFWVGYFHHYNVWLVILIYVFQLDLLVAEKLFLDFQHFTSGMITQHKSNFLNNEALAVLAVKNNFHLFHQNKKNQQIHVLHLNSLKLLNRKKSKKVYVSRFQLNLLQAPLRK